MGNSGVARRSSLPATLRIVQAVGRVTFTEIIRDKILYNVILVGVVLFALSFVASTLTFLRPERVLLDFGLSALSLSCSLIAALAGAAMLGREFERRTIFVALSRPISRLQYVLGKFCGLAAVIAVNWALLTGVYVAMIVAQTGSLELVFGVGGSVPWAVALLFFQSLVLASFAVLFSTFSTTSLSVMFTGGLYLVGANIPELRMLALKLPPGAGRSALETAAAVLPNFQYFNVGQKVTYDLPVSAAFGLTGIAYGAALCAFALLLSGLLINTRES